MTSLVERVIFDENLRACKKIRKKFIFSCLGNIYLKSNDNKCHVIYDLLKKCEKNKKQVTFSGP